MDIRQEILIATSPQRVWRALTDPYELAHWACDKAECTEDTYVLAGMTVYGGNFDGRILRRIEGRELSVQWSCGESSTEVLIRIEPEAQSGLPSADFAKVSLAHSDVPEASAVSPMPHATLGVMWRNWLLRLALWTERAQSQAYFHYEAQLSDSVKQHVVVDADLSVAWRYLTVPNLRQRWFNATDQLGEELERVERNFLKYAKATTASDSITFRIEPMAEARTLVQVHQQGSYAENRMEDHLGWQNCLLTLARVVARPVIRQTVWIDTLPEQVWKWFTSEVAMQKWWNEHTVYEPKVGGCISFSDHGADLYGMVTELKAPHRFAFTFVEDGTQGLRDPFVVTLDLETEQGGTRVYLTQSGFERFPEDVQRRVFAGFQRGWAASPELDRLAVVAAEERLSV